MDDLIQKLAAARKVAKEQGEGFVRIPNSVLAEIIAALLGRTTKEETVDSVAGRSL